MGKIKKIIKYFIDSDYRFIVDSRYGKNNHLSDEDYLKRKYKACMKKDLDLNNPQTFNEKMQWLKLNDRQPIYSTMVDKYAAKQFVAEQIGAEYVIPTIGVWDKFDDIDFNLLPDKFVLKCTHDSGGLVICKNKQLLNIKKAKKKIERSMNRNFYYVGREWPYKDVTPRIIAEQYMEDEKNKCDLSDYKIHCFNGEPKVIQVITDRFSKDGMINDHYSPSWEKLDITRGHHVASNRLISRPQEMDEMLELARRLSAGIPYLRTDFYIVNHHIYFGELTFYPAAGFKPFEPKEWDKTFGSWIELPN